MSDATIVDWCESHGAPPLHLSEPSKTWIDRMWHACLDVDVGPDEFCRLDERFVAYLDALSNRNEAALADGCFVRLMELVETVQVCPECGRPICPCCGHAKAANGS